jgi:predicted ABC-type ATPase
VNPQLVMLAGPNGAGKSTFYARHLATSALPFLNADAFAAQTGVDAKDSAAILDASRDYMVARRLGFITETVFSDPVGAKLDLLRRAIDVGYDVTLIFIGIASPALSSLRIDQRVAEGGHDVPRDRLQRRYEASLANLAQAITFVHAVRIYDNSLVEAPHRLIATYQAGKRTFVASEVPRWANKLVKRR